MGNVISIHRPEMADLHAIGLQIEVPQGAMYIDRGDIIDENHRELWGSCISQYLGGKISIEIAVNGLLPHNQKLFARGHEEGHAIMYLGELDLFKNVTDSVGIHLHFMDKEYCTTHDRATRRFLKPGYGTNADFITARKKSFYEKEMIAHAGGLVALVKNSVDPRIIDHVRTKIDERDLDVYPVADVISLF